MNNPLAVRGAAFALAVFALVGCYNYVPIEPVSVPIGSNVRVRLTRAGAAQMDELTLAGVLPDGGVVVRGSLMNGDEGFVRLLVPVTSGEVGFNQTVMEQEVLIPAANVFLVELQEFDRTATFVMITGGAVAATAVVYAILNNARRPSTGGQIPDPDETWLSVLLSIPFR